jgi:hypothetical protein
MSGVTLRVNPQMTDLCREDSCVSILKLDSNDCFIDEVLMSQPDGTREGRRLPH